MESGRENNKISLHLSDEEALIFLDWLIRFNQHSSNFFEDQAEERILFDLEAILESQMPEIVAKDYKKRLETARKKIRDPLF